MLSSIEVLLISPKPNKVLKVLIWLWLWRFERFMRMRFLDYFKHFWVVRKSFVKSKVERGFFLICSKIAYCISIFNYNYLLSISISLGVEVRSDG